MEFRRFELDWTSEALGNLRDLAARAPRQAQRVVDTLTHYADLGMSPGRATPRAGVYYAIARPLSPIGVFYEIVDHRYFRVLALVDARRLPAPP